jgi:hypothetical protein
VSELYDTDTAAWAETQADALRRRATNEIDWDNVAEEIESLARSDRREIRNRLAVICEHLLKWEYQPGGRCGSWRGSVREARRQIADLIEESPSLQPYPATRLAWAYGHGREKAEDDAGLLDLPLDCPWTVEQLLDHAFWPGLSWEPDEP